MKLIITSKDFKDLENSIFERIQPQLQKIEEEINNFRTIFLNMWVLLEKNEKNK